MLPDLAAQHEAWAIDSSGLCVSSAAHPAAADDGCCIFCGPQVCSAEGDQGWTAGSNHCSDAAAAAGPPEAGDGARPGATPGQDVGKARCSAAFSYRQSICPGQQYSDGVQCWCCSSRRDTLLMSHVRLGSTVSEAPVADCLPASETRKKDWAK